MTTAMTPVRFSYRGADNAEIVAYRWDPAGQARGIVQLTHGMGEHVLRYAPLAAAFTAEGFVVYGQDHRGHGASAPTEADLGQLGQDGWGQLVNDIDLLAIRARAENPDLPLILVAHSMGSFAAQQYLPVHSGRIDAVVLTGTATLDLLEPALDLDQPLSLAMFNGAFEPARTDYDWLSRDEEQVDLYVADPRCGFGLDPVAVRDMFVGARPLAETAVLQGIRPDLPVYIAVGDQDPVNGQLALVGPLVDRYRGAGLTDVTLHVYEGARHEIFNETNRDEVFADLIAWVDKLVGHSPR